MTSGMWFVTSVLLVNYPMFSMDYSAVLTGDIGQKVAFDIPTDRPEIFFEVYDWATKHWSKVDITHKDGFVRLASARAFHRQEKIQVRRKYFRQETTPKERVKV